MFLFSFSALKLFMKAFLQTYKLKRTVMKKRYTSEEVMYVSRSHALAPWDT